MSKALEYYGRALEINPDYSDAWNKFTENLLPLGIPDITEDALKQAIAGLKILRGKPSAAAGYLEARFYKRTGLPLEALIKLGFLIECLVACKIFIWATAYLLFHF